MESKRGHRPSMAGKSPRAGLENMDWVSRLMSGPALATHPPGTAEDLRRMPGRKPEQPEKHWPPGAL